MTEYVFDTEAIIAYLYSEPGHETVAETLDTVFEDEIEGSLNEANASEVLCLVARFEGTGGDEPTKESLRDADCDLHALERRGLTIRAAPCDSPARSKRTAISRLRTPTQSRSPRIVTQRSSSGRTMTSRTPTLISIRVSFARTPCRRNDAPNERPFADRVAKPEIEIVGRTRCFVLDTKNRSRSTPSESGSEYEMPRRLVKPYYGPRVGFEARSFRSLLRILHRLSPRSRSSLAGGARSVMFARRRARGGIRTTVVPITAFASLPASNPVRLHGAHVRSHREPGVGFEPTNSRLQIECLHRPSSPGALASYPPSGLSVSLSSRFSSSTRCGMYPSLAYHRLAAALSASTESATAS